VSRLALALAVAGCAEAYQVRPSRVPDLVRSYEKSNEAVVQYQGKRYPIRPAQEPQLHLTVQRSSRAQAGAVPERDELRAPLGSIQAHDETLTFPGARRARVSQIAAAELELEGEQPGPLPKGAANRGDRPLSARRTFVGGQLGGTSYAQVIARFRIVGPLLFDSGLGGFLTPGPGGFGACGSLGPVVDVPVHRHWSLYAGGGVGGGFVSGGDAGAQGTTATRYYYGRAGIALRLGIDQLPQVGIDGRLLAWSHHAGRRAH